MTKKSSMRVLSLADCLELSADRVARRTTVLNADGTETSYQELNAFAD